MEYIDRFKRMNSINGITDKDYYTKVAKDNLNEYLKSTPNKIEFTLNSDITKYVGSMVTAHGEKQGEKNLIAPLNVVIKDGDYVHYNSKIWLVVGTVDTPAKNKYKLVKCNREISFISRIDKKSIVTMPIVLVNWTMYSNGLEETRPIIIQNGKRQMAVRGTREALLFNEGDRFMINRNKIYKVTHIDDTQDGVLYLTMEQSDKMPNDNFELNIADYIIDNTAPPTPTGQLIIQGANSLFRNTEETYSLAMDNGTTVIDGKWAWVVEPSTSATIRSVSADNKSIILFASGGVGTVRIRVSLNTYGAEKQVEVIDYF